MRKKGKRVRDRQEKWNKKKRLNFEQGKTTTVQVDSTFANMLWHLDSFGPWVRSTSLSLQKYRSRTKSPPFFLSILPLTNKKTGSHGSFILNISYFLFSIKSSPTLKCIRFLILWTLGNWVITKKQETSSFLSPNYHCMIVNWVWLFWLTTVSECGSDHTPFRHAVMGGYHYHVTYSYPSVSLLGNKVWLDWGYFAWSNYL